MSSIHSPQCTDMGCSFLARLSKLGRQKDRTIQHTISMAALPGALRRSSEQDPLRAGTDLRLGGTCLTSCYLSMGV
jgi:hypothetical protein